MGAPTDSPQKFTVKTKILVSVGQDSTCLLCSEWLHPAFTELNSSFRLLRLSSYGVMLEIPVTMEYDLILSFTDIDEVSVSHSRESIVN